MSPLGKSSGRDAGNAEKLLGQLALRFRLGLDLFAWNRYQLPREVHKRRGIAAYIFGFRLRLHAAMITRFEYHEFALE